ncbi:MAG TPA: hypothetical protein D7H85_00815 [Candidatus Poseidoniales archaeon]|nr:MAG TPA: hypothetical protein D7H85_00815 [Candidatus Poseidoniales archaeon]
MGRLSAFLLVFTLVAMSAGPLLAPPSPSDSPIDTFDTSGRALVDFTVSDISFGNVSSAASTFTQPNGSSVDYIYVRETIALSFEFRNAGTRLDPASAVGTMEVWHPIGFVVESWSVNLSLAGGQSTIESVDWTPAAAHSHLSDDGTLGGGYILRGSVDAGVLDGNEANDVYDENIIVALYHDRVESALCGDVDGDGSVDCPNALSVPMWVGAGYEVGNDFSIKDEGQFQMLASSTSAEGNRHLQIASDSGVYISSRNDRMWWAWPDANQNCNDGFESLGYGQNDGTLSTAYGTYICTVQVKGFNFVSLQARVQAWGSMGQGDELALEANTGLSQQRLNLSEATIGATSADWTPVIWNMTDVFPNSNYGLAFHFSSDNSGATQGIHVDDLMLFGIERVDEYTIDLDCDEPTNGAFNVIPADPSPPSLRCTLTNNGYRTVSPTIHTKVDNSSWMSQFPLRIDSTDPLDHDNTVTMMPVDAGNTSEFWVNLSIPAGSNVETVNWSVWLNDSVNAQNKGQRHFDVNVISSYSASFRQVNIITPALTLPPTATGNVTMSLQNTGNEDVAWSFGAYFNDPLWSDSNLEWFDSTGSPATSIMVARGATVNVIAQFTAPDDAVPGPVEITLLTNAIPPASAQATWSIQIEVPPVSDLSISAMSDDINAPSNGQMVQVEMTLVNNGNSDENYNLSLLADYRLDASLSIVSTGLLDAFGGDTTVYLILPMPYGLRPDIYLVEVTATSESDPNYEVVQQIRLTVPPTYELTVEDLDMSGQTFSPGDSCRTGKWEVTNIGNMDDRFSITVDHPESITVELRDVNGQPLSPAETPVVAPGSSYNVTFCYAFVEGTSGSQTLSLTGTSINYDGSGAAPSDTGSAVFDVGTQGWINVVGQGPMVIDRAIQTETLTFELHNRHPTVSQQIRLDISANEMTAYGFNPRIVETDREFQLGPDQRRIITVELDPSEVALLNLPEDQITRNFTLEIDADLDTVEYLQEITFVRMQSESEDTASGSGIINILGVIFGVLVVIALLVVFVRIIMGTQQIEDDVVSLADYQSSVADKYREIAPAPEIPTAPTMMPSQDAFTAPPAPAEPVYAPAPAVPAVAPAEPVYAPAPAVQAVAPPPEINVPLEFSNSVFAKVISQNGIQDGAAFLSFAAGYDADGNGYLRQSELERAASEYVTGGHNQPATSPAFTDEQLIASGWTQEQIDAARASGQI